MIDQVAKFVKALNSDVGPWALSFAISLGMIMGLTPLWSVHNLLVLLLAFILRIHLATFWLAWAVFSGIAYMLDPVMIQVGEALLTQDSLVPTWTAMFQSDFWRVTRFNNTLVMGSLVVSLLAFFPLAIVMRILVTQYRARLVDWMNRLKILKLLKATKIYQLYDRVSG